MKKNRLFVIVPEHAPRQQVAFKSRKLAREYAQMQNLNWPPPGAKWSVHEVTAMDFTPLDDARH